MGIKSWIQQSDIPQVFLLRQSNFPPGYVWQYLALGLTTQDFRLTKFLRFSWVTSCSSQTASLAPCCAFRESSKLCQICAKLSFNHTRNAYWASFRVSLLRFQKQSSLAITRFNQTSTNNKNLVLVPKRSPSNTNEDYYSKRSRANYRA